MPHRGISCELQLSNACKIYCDNIKEADTWKQNTSMKHQADKKLNGLYMY